MTYDDWKTAAPEGDDDVAGMAECHPERRCADVRDSTRMCEQCCDAEDRERDAEETAADFDNDMAAEE